MTDRIAESELILNPDGSIYHLNLKPGEIAHDIITVGDPNRVDKVAKHFERIDVEVRKREFITITGWIGSKRITVISTGIGTDNIDIVFTELDALVNIDFSTRRKKEEHTTLRFYRIGTSGSLFGPLDVDMFLVSSMAIGMDGLMHFYKPSYTQQELQLNSMVQQAIKELPAVIPYCNSATPSLVNKFSSLGMKGITISATGFYGPQGRKVIAEPRSSTFLDDMAEIKYGELQVTNLEMETAGMYGMASILGHEVVSLNAILANRVNQTFSDKPKELVEELIRKFLDILCA